jgi:hypothetical protein
VSIDSADSNWRHEFVERGGLRHLFGIFSSGVLESAETNKDWSEWKQDCLASLLKILCYLGVMEEETEYLNELLYDVNEAPRKRVKRRKGSTEKTPIPRLNDVKYIFEKLCFEFFFKFFKILDHVVCDGSTTGDDKTDKYSPSLFSSKGSESLQNRVLGESSSCTLRNGPPRLLGLFP